MYKRQEHEFKDYPRSQADYAACVAAYAGKIGKDGTFNMLLGDGKQLFARCSTKLHYIVRKAPFKQATLADEELTVDFAEVTTPNDRVAVIATMPLTRDEVWTAGEPNTMWLFRGGKLIKTLPS